MQLPPPSTMIQCPACRNDFTPPAAASLPYGCAHCSSQVVGAYCDLEVIGDGGMGKVYRARRPDMRDQRVAIKIPKTSDVQSRERFNREIAASAMLRHENIVRAFDCGEVDGQLFLVMQLEEGRLLSDVVRAEGRLSCQRVGQIVRDIAKGLAHAKACSIVNRDIKPENILIGNDGLAKLLDFGLAIIGGTGSSVERATAAGTLLGTIAFMAPEQARDPRDVTIAADIYALGCTAYYAHSGHPPFAGTREEILHQHSSAPRPEILAIRPDVSATFAELIKRMMAVAPAERPEPHAIVAEISSCLSFLSNESPAPIDSAIHEGEPVEEGEPIEEGQSLDEDDGLEPQEGKLLEEDTHAWETAVHHFDTPAQSAAPPPDLPPPDLPPPDMLPHADDDRIPTLPVEAAIEEGESIEEGDAIEELPLGSLVGPNVLPDGDAPAPVPAAAPSSRKKVRSPQHKKQLRNLIALTVVAGLVMLGVFGAQRFVLAPPNPQTKWDKIQENYQLHTWKLVEKQLAEFEAEYPEDPHVAEIPFFLAMCDAGRDIFSQTGDADSGLQKIDKVFLDFRDTPEYDLYCSDLFLDLQRLIERFVERIEKTSQPEPLASARKAHELLNTVAESMTEDWVAKKVSELGADIRQSEKKLEVALARTELLDMLAGVSSATATDDSLDRAYEDAKALLQKHAALQGDAEIAAAFSSAYASEGTRVTYEPLADETDAAPAIDLSTGDETIFVVWGEPSEASPSTGNGVFLSLADGVLFAFDDAGTHLWSHRLGLDSHRLPVSLKPSSTSPDAVIAVSAVDNSLIAIASKTGRVLWRYAPGADQDLAASLTISEWKPAKNKPSRVRGLIPTADGEIHVIELVRGKRMGRFRTNMPMTVGGTFDPETQLLFFPADSKRVLAIDPAVIEAQDQTSSAVRSVLFTNHLSGSLRSRPLVVGQYLLLTELLDLDDTQVRAFELQDPIGFAKPDAEPVRHRELKGWSWFTPPLTPDRMTVVTDKGELGVFGLNLDNPDEALYPLILDGRGECPRLAIDDPYRAMAIHSDEDLLWVMAGGTLRQIALDILKQRITTVWPKDESDAEVVGMPLHEATFDREAERLYLTTRSPDASRAEFTSVDANTGDKLWSRQLGVHPIGDPIVSGNAALLVDRTGRILQLSVNGSENGESHVNVVADDSPPAQESAGELMRLRDVEGKEYLVLPVDSGHSIAIRPIDPSLKLQRPWDTVPLPSSSLQGRPAVVDDYLMVPTADGSLQRISLNGSKRRPLNEQTYQWAGENSVAPDDAPAFYPLGSGRVLFVLRKDLKWLQYVTPGGVGLWKEQKHVLLDSPADGELAITKDYLFITGQGKSLYRVRRDGTSDPDTWQLDGRPTAGPYMIGDDVFVVLDGRKLVAFSQSSDKPRWSVGPRAGHLCGRPFVAGQWILVTDDDGKVIVVNPDNGEINREWQLRTGAIPVAASIPFGFKRILTPLADGTLSWHSYASANQSPPEPGASQ